MEKWKYVFKFLTFPKYVFYLFKTYWVVLVEFWSFSSLCIRTSSFISADGNKTYMNPLERIRCKYKKPFSEGCMCPTSSISWLITRKTTHNGALLCNSHNTAIHHPGHWMCIWHFPVRTVVSETYKRNRVNVKLKQVEHPFLDLHRDVDQEQATIKC